MPIQFTENKSGASRLNFNANPRSRMASIVSVGWDNVTGKPSFPYVQYDTDQGLTAAQQEQARENVGLVGQPFNNKAGVEAATIPAAVLFVRTAGYHSAGDGGGALYKRSASEPAHDLKIEDAGGGWWEIAYSGVIDVRQAGAVGDAGTVDDAPAFQSALDYVATYGGCITGNGRFGVESALTCDIATGSDIRSETRVRMAGAGEGSFVIDWRGSQTTNPVLKFIGTAFSGDVELHVERVKIVGYSNVINGLHLQDLAYFKIADVEVHGFNYGFYGRDCISGSFTRCRGTANVRNWDLSRDDTFSVSAISFFQCVSGSAKEWGVYANKPTQFNWYSGSIEGNGRDPTTFPTELGGMKIVDPCVVGSVAANIDGVYFENNRGLADIVIETDTDPAIVNVTGCNFNRNSSTDYVTNPILVRHDSGNGFFTLNLLGNSFNDYNGYTPDAGRMYWAFSGTGLNYAINWLGGHMESVTESPLGATNIHHAIVGQLPAIHLRDLDGGRHEVVGNAGNLLLRADHAAEVADSGVILQADGTEIARALSGAGLRLATGMGLLTGASNGNTALLRAYDVDGAAYTTFGTLTAGNTPTFDLDDATTKSGNYIYRAGGTDIPLTDGGTGASTAQAAMANLKGVYILGMSFAGWSHTGNTTETALATVTIPANAMGANGTLFVIQHWTYTSSANNKIYKLRFNGIGGTAFSDITRSTGITGERTPVFISNRGTTNSQVGAQAAFGAGFGTNTATKVTSAVDTTAAVDLVFTGQLANSGETITLEGYIVMLLVP